MMRFLRSSPWPSALFSREWRESSFRGQLTSVSYTPFDGCTYDPDPNPDKPKRCTPEQIKADLQAIAALRPLGVAGAIVGKALYAGAFTLAEALKAVEA